MDQLISNIKDCIQNSLSFEHDFIANLMKSEIIWKEEYPIAIAHAKARMKDNLHIQLFQDMGLLDEEGLSPSVYKTKDLQRIKKEAPSCVQTVQLLALKKEPESTIRYQAKRQNDFWKKIQDVEHIQSSFDYSVFDTKDDICKLEFKLREIIRKRKEVHAFKDIGFIWMAVTQEDVSKLFMHYFHDNYTLVNGQYHIGWSASLKDINMRYFVCQPE